MSFLASRACPTDISGQWPRTISLRLPWSYQWQRQDFLPLDPLAGTCRIRPRLNEKSWGLSCGWHCLGSVLPGASLGPPLRGLLGSRLAVGSSPLPTVGLPPLVVIDLTEPPGPNAGMP